METSTQLMDAQATQAVNLGEMFKVSNAAMLADHLAYTTKEPPTDLSQELKSQCSDYVQRRARNNMAVRKSRCKKKEKYEKVHINMRWF